MTSGGSVLSEGASANRCRICFPSADSDNCKESDAEARSTWSNCSVWFLGIALSPVWRSVTLFLSFWVISGSFSVEKESKSPRIVSRNWISEACCTTSRRRRTVSTEQFKFKRRQREQGDCLSHFRFRLVHSGTCQCLPGRTMAHGARGEKMKHTLTCQRSTLRKPRG